MEIKKYNCMSSKEPMHLWPVQNQFNSEPISHKGVKTRKDFSINDAGTAGIQ